MQRRTNYIPEIDPSPEIWRGFYGNLIKHQPVCPEISERELKQTFIGFWPMQNGVARIPYAFSRASEKSGMFYTYLLKLIGLPKGVVRTNIHPAIEADYKEAVRFALERWREISNGRIEFFEVTSAEFLRKNTGISFNLASGESIRNALGGAGFVIHSFNNNGYFKKAYVFLADSHEFWWLRDQRPYNNSINNLRAYMASVVVHEQGHTLGLNLDGWRSPTTVVALRNTVDGVYCTPMTYREVFAHSTGECKTNCVPSYQVYPTKFDQRMLALVSNGDTPTCEMNRYRFERTFEAMVVEPFLSSVRYSLLHASIWYLLANLYSQPNEYLLANKTARMVANGIVLGTAYYMEENIWPVALFLATVSIENLPNHTRNKLQQILNEIVRFQLDIFLMNLALTIIKGGCPIPFILSIIFSIVGSGSGHLLGMLFGYVGASVVSTFPKAVYDAYQQQIAPDTTSDIPISTHKMSFFNGGFSSAKTEISDIENQLDFGSLRQKKVI